MIDVLTILVVFLIVLYFLNLSKSENFVSLTKGDGVPYGGYMPQIIRPINSTYVRPDEGSDCNWPCYSDKKFQIWTSEQDAIDYYAMRPLMDSDTYMENLREMFKGMIISSNKYYGEIPSDENFYKVGQYVCQDNEKNIMDWIMEKVAIQVSTMPSMQKSSLKYEQFTYTDVKLYQYIVDQSPESDVFFRIIFNLYNPLRSISTMTEATMLITDGTPMLIGMKLIYNEKYMNEPTEDDINHDNIDWDYINTLPVQKFNDKGYYSNDPSENIVILGGIPETIKNKIRESGCENANLTNCTTPRYSGFLAPSSRLAPLDGSVSNTFSDPIPYFRAPI